MIVIKLGGSRGLDYADACQDIAYLAEKGEPVVVVHGGSHETNLISEALGHAPRFVTSVSGHVSRYTDRETIEIFAMATAGKINTLLVEGLQKLGVNALGLSGVDGRLLEARRKSALRIIEDGRNKILRGDYSGQIESVNTLLLRLLLEASYVPVVAPLAISHEGDAVNVDADRAASAIASALHAETLVILSNVPGLLRDVGDEGSVIERISLQDAPAYLDRYAQGRMKKKLLGAIEGLQGGVARVVIADGRIEQPIRAALEGKGTVIG